ncbi:MAG TPA: DsbE family thiol:disulfide interchange protein [Stellaceae bacterium]|nr:DsbE family thiol:disulfide interchange protein [Stellaceae bacterium]
MQASARTSPDPPAAPRRLSRLWFVLPVLAFIGLVATFIAGLNYDPRLVPSPLVGKPAPAFSLPPAANQTRGLSSADLRGKVTLVNVFASWCVSCRDEHPLLMALKQQGIVPIAGIDYKDTPADAARWLAAMGDPYNRIGADATGRTAIDWGVYGVPESFLVGPDGRIAYKQIGPITPEALQHKILPLAAELRRHARPAPAAGG